METKKTYLLGTVLACALLAGCASSTSTDDTDGQADQMDSAAAAADQSTMAAEDTTTTDEAANLESVFYFDFDQATLTSETRAALDAQIARLKGATGKVRLEGHADERGTREYNMALGERRANAVANYMVINGIERYRIETVSFGEESPVDSSSNEAAWAKNRRVELK